MTDTLIAGRELDALVAEKVLGWTEIGWSEPRDYALGVPPLFPGMRLAVHRYSTDIAAAWKAVENLNEKGWRLQLAHEGGLSDQWVASFLRSEGTGQEESTGDALAWSPPLAICLAALKAVGQ